ncbi:hypothetical protein Tco_0742806 [Tanacetum coccineum]
MLMNNSLHSLVNNERQTGLEVDNRNRSENRSHITHKSMARIGIVEDGLQHYGESLEKYGVETLICVPFPTLQ